MKTAAILFALLSLAVAAEWRRVASTSQAVYYAADARTDRSGGEVRVWEKIAPLDTEAGREYAESVRAQLADRGVARPERLAYMTTRRRYRCADGQAAFEQLLYHDARGEIIARDPPERLMRWESPAPDSIGERLMLDACKQEAEQY